MDIVKLFVIELKIMDIVWDKEPALAKEITLIAAETIGWNKNTTYTIINKLIEKNAIERTEPNFICTSLVKKEDVRKAETQSLIYKLYNLSLHRRLVEQKQRSELKLYCRIKSLPFYRHSALLHW